VRARSPEILEAARRDVETMVSALSADA
jgi:hypothetical protein